MEKKELTPNASPSAQQEEKTRKPRYLKISEVDPDDIDDSAEREYFDKCRFIDQQPLVDVSRCYLPDFIAQVFERDLGEGEVEPFETRGCDRYLQWREEENKNLPHESYKQSQFQYNPIAFFKSKATRKKPKEGQEPEYDKNSHKIVLKDDWEGRDWLQTRQFAIMSPITYVGGTTANKYARYLYAFAIDLDGVGGEQLHVLFSKMTTFYPSNMRKPVPMCGKPFIPLPNIIVNSGHGLHLYYTMRYPLAMFKQNVKYLQAICRALYKVVVYPPTKTQIGTTTQDNVQCLGIYHGFRLPETFTKTLKMVKGSIDYVGTGVPIQAWKTEADHYTINDLLPWLWYSDTGVDEQLKPAVIAELERGGRLLNPKRLTLEQARKKYGEDWYKNRTLPKGRFITDRRLYDWWLNKMKKREGVKEGFRYYCIMALASFAAKCNIPFEELKEDAYSLITPFDELTNIKAPFEAHDVQVALRAYRNPDSVRWSPQMLSSWTDIPFKKVKRNKRKQVHHLEMIRMMRDLKRKQDGKESWDAHAGRKVATLENSKEAQLINEWMVNHPESTNKSLCARELGIDRKTVRKWWVQIEDNILDAEVNDSASIDELVKQMEPISLGYQHVYTSEDFKEALLDPDSGIERTIVPVVPMAQLFAPNSDFSVPGYSHEEVIEIVTTGKWQELGWNLQY